MFGFTLKLGLILNVPGFAEHDLENCIIHKNLQPFNFCTLTVFSGAFVDVVVQVIGLWGKGNR